MSNPIVASLGDIVVSTEDVDTLNEWLNDQASAQPNEGDKKNTRKPKKGTRGGPPRSPGAVLSFDLY